MNIFRPLLHSLPVLEIYVLPSDSHAASDVNECIEVSGKRMTSLSAFVQ